MRILLADDHPLFRSGVRNLLETTDDMQIVGEASSGEEAVEKALALKPDVILMDIRMQGLNGIEATKQIREALPQVHILILTMFKDDQSVFTAMRAGARGYTLKDVDEDELLYSIRMVANGGAVFGADIASRMMDYFADSRTPTALDPLFANLTAREREILALIAKNESNARIAAKLHLSSKTVANYVTTILNKLHVTDRHAARLLANRQNLGVELPEE
ncbi:DNA-binding response regulator [Brevibacillus fluminis]|uniref:DNA-binding response regulator n=1 Tax=Brevibacillus fluminis TaxID=511487 RepID=A0A3M8CSN9_9BACL|nr:response regulator transcription factor [Brevibacillus fluminis]RNB78539.1 DNA-binding response regulator [Brevibacillus fluminis]